MSAHLGASMAEAAGRMQAGAVAVASLQPLVAMVEQATSAAVLCFCEDVLANDGSAVRPLTLPAHLHASLDHALGLTARYQLLLRQRKAQVAAARADAAASHGPDQRAAASARRPGPVQSKVHPPAARRSRQGELLQGFRGGGQEGARGSAWWQVPAAAHGEPLGGVLPPVNAGYEGV